ncbi:L-fucose kinase-like isoform X2 [Glandiceps talaboti]
MCTLPDGDVALVTGVVYISVKIAEKLLSFHVVPPITGCTYMGMDSGGKPIQLSLFFDFLLCMASEVTEEDFVSGDRAGAYGSLLQTMTDREVQAIKLARAMLWKVFHDTELKAVCLEDGCHDYMNLLAAAHHKHLTNCPLQVEGEKRWIWQNMTYSHSQDNCSIEDNSIIINSQLSNEVQIGPKCVVSHSKLQGPLTISKDSILSSISEQASRCMAGLQLSVGIVLQGINITLGGPSTDRKSCKVYTVMGKYDNLQTTYVKGTSTFCNSPWVIFLRRTGIDKEDLWPADKTDYDRTLFNAKLYPVWHCTEDVGIQEVLWLQGAEVKDSDKMLQRWKYSWRLSLQEILPCIDVSVEFQWRRDLFYDIAQHQMKDVLRGTQSKGLLPYFKSAVVDGYSEQILDTLDTIAVETDSPGVAARTLACIADVLGCIADEKGSGGLRSGPAANQAWKPAFCLLEEGKMCDGVKAMKEERKHWMDRADDLVRAARHYEGAEQILIRHAVMTARQFISTSPSESPSIGQWVVARCPARIDLSGGWSDTPPITYEHGGAVTNAAITIDGKKPMGAKCRKIEDLHLVLVLGTDPTNQVRLVCRELSDLADYNNPTSPGALLKAAFVCAEVITLPSDTSLKQQLSEKYGSGFELQTWSDLAQGSGLGTSSILAGAVIAALWRTSGKSYDNDSLMHAVLHLEQMLTTGGGWQDQVGGLTPGVKIGRSKPGLPLKVETNQLNMAADTVQRLNERLVLLYTGDIGKVGECLDTYWGQKKIMAPGCEPKAVERMMEALKPHVCGQALAGAGGGGYMYVITKQPNDVDTVKKVLAGLEGCESVTVHEVSIDQTGLTIDVEEIAEAVKDSDAEGDDKTGPTADVEVSSETMVPDADSFDQVGPSVIADMSSEALKESDAGIIEQTGPTEDAEEISEAVKNADAESHDKADLTIEVGVSPEALASDADSIDQTGPSVNVDASSETVKSDAGIIEQTCPTEDAEEISVSEAVKNADAESDDKANPTAEVEVSPEALASDADSIDQTGPTVDLHVEEIPGAVEKTELESIDQNDTTVDVEASSEAMKSGVDSVDQTGSTGDGISVAAKKSDTESIYQTCLTMDLHIEETSEEVKQSDAEIIDQTGSTADVHVDETSEGVEKCDVDNIGQNSSTVDVHVAETSEVGNKPEAGSIDQTGPTVEVEVSSEAVKSNTDCFDQADATTDVHIQETSEAVKKSDTDSIDWTCSTVEIELSSEVANKSGTDSNNQTAPKVDVEGSSEVVKSSDESTDQAVPIVDLHIGEMSDVVKKPGSEVINLDNSTVNVQVEETTEAVIKPDTHSTDQTGPAVEVEGSSATVKSVTKSNDKTDPTVDVYVSS